MVQRRSLIIFFIVIASFGISERAVADALLVSDLSNISSYCNVQGGLDKWLNHLKSNTQNLPLDSKEADLEINAILNKVGGGGRLNYDFSVTAIQDPINDPQRGFNDIACNTPEPGLQCAEVNGKILQLAAEALGKKATILTSSASAQGLTPGAHVSLLISSPNQMNCTLISFNDTPHVLTRANAFKDPSQREAECGREALQYIGASVGYTLGDRIIYYSKQGSIMTDRVLGKCNQANFETMGDGSNLLNISSGHLIFAKVGVADEGNLTYLGYSTCHKNGHGTWDIGLAINQSQIRESPQLWLNYSYDKCHPIGSNLYLETSAKATLVLDVADKFNRIAPGSFENAFQEKLKGNHFETAVQLQYVPNSYTPLSLQSGYIQHWVEASQINDKSDAATHWVEKVGVVGGPADSSGQFVYGFAAHLAWSKDFGKLVAELQANYLSRAMAGQPSQWSTDFGAKYQMNTRSSLYGKVSIGNGPTTDPLNLDNLIRPQMIAPGSSTTYNLGFKMRL